MFADFIRLVDTKGQIMSPEEIEELLTFKSQANILSVRDPRLMTKMGTGYPGKPKLLILLLLLQPASYHQFFNRKQS